MHHKDIVTNLINLSIYLLINLFNLVFKVMLNCFKYWLDLLLLSSKLTVQIFPSDCTLIECKHIYNTYIELMYIIISIDQHELNLIIQMKNYDE